MNSSDTLKKFSSKIYHETVGPVVTWLRDRQQQAWLKEVGPGEYFVAKIPPYISQLADADRQLIAGFYGQIDDEAAVERFGAENTDLLSYWAWRSCAIVAMQMVLSAELEDNFAVKTMELIQQTLEFDGYDQENDVGWYHQSLVELAREFGIVASLDKFVPPLEIARKISEGKYVLSSMKSQTGGHIILLYGFKVDADGKLMGFFTHDPNDFNSLGDRAFISLPKFQELSTRRTIDVKSNDEVSPAKQNNLEYQSEQTRRRIEASVGVEKMWWKDKIIASEQAGLESGELIEFPNETQHTRMIGVLQRGQEPKTGRPELLSLTNKIENIFAEKLLSKGIDPNPIMLAISSLYRDQAIQEKMREAFAHNASRGFSSHFAGAAIDFDSVCYYQRTEENKIESINKKHHLYNPEVAIALNEALTELEASGVCHVIREVKHELIDGQMSVRPTCHHVCVSPEAQQ